MRSLMLIIALIFSLQNAFSQVLLDANGGGDTYGLITSVLAPGHNPIEVPDCNHVDFGDHIDEIFDNDLNINVFRFHIHTTPDNDRCINFDRQRNEIKSYSQSPDNLLGVIGETVEYKWKFKLDAGFQSSPNFTHIHQLKAVGGSESSMPLITLTTRKNTPDELELRYAETTSQITLHEVDLTPFKGVWCEATETVTYGEKNGAIGERGTYDIVIKKVSDNSTLFNYSNNNIRMWKTDADFVRPKWGVYRSLNNVADLRDEAVLFANFSITETAILPVEFISFTGLAVGQEILLDWETVSEHNNKGFEIQKSTNLTQWTVIDFIESKGNTNANTAYDAVDKNPVNGLNYYRLKQIDLDGDFQYSDTISVDFISINDDLRIFPNPTSQVVEMLGLTEDAYFEIMDKSGKVVLKGNTDNFQIDLLNLPTAVYLLRLQIGEETVVERLVKK